MNETLLLDGEWRFQMDPDRVGWKERWYEKELPSVIRLPGTMEENGYGFVPEQIHIRNLNHTRYYSGMAWYSREIDIPESWSGKHVTLLLERCQWESHIWLDGEYIGMRNSLSTPHIYEFRRSVAPGKHTLTMMIDNSNMKYVEIADQPDAAEPDMAAKDEMGRDINIHLTLKPSAEKKLNCGIHDLTYAWNGIVGRMELRAMDPVWIEHVDVYPDVRRKQARVKLDIGNLAGRACAGTVTVACRPEDAAHSDSGEPAEIRASFPVHITAESSGMHEFEVNMGEDVKLWSLQDPNLYTMKLTLEAEGCRHVCEVTFGMRELVAEGTQFALNGRIIFLRGTLEGCAFPHTGYPPADVAWWERVFRVMKDYGLNHMRMHTFCPPEAAFIAADRVGIAIQAEVPGTSCPGRDEGKEVEQYLSLELERMLKTYGNHPSLFFVSMGNEQLVVGNRDFLARHQEVLRKKVEYGQKTDPRHLYTSTSHPYSPGRIDDFYISATCHDPDQETEEDAAGEKVVGKMGAPLNGILWGGPDPLTTSRFCLEVPDTMKDFGREIARIGKPVITHEVGQWAVYPNLKEIDKYTGVLKAKNFELIRDDLSRKGLLDLADDFVRASGQLSLRLYKEEIESALRTPGLAGFQLLDIHDYPAQGTSTVGILDVFWDSKGLIEPHVFRGFCSDTVPLLRMAKYVWTNDETYAADIEVAHYGPEDIRGAEVAWEISDERGCVAAAGSFDRTDIAAGRLNRIGKAEAKLSGVGSPRKWSVRVRIEGTPFENKWEMWVYPSSVPEAPRDAAVIAEEPDDETLKLLQDGGNVLLVLKPGTVKHALPGVFTTVFWNVLMKKQVGTMGLLCDPSHPLFEHFPTEFHTNWQWWDIVMHSAALNLDGTPAPFRPIVQVIDAFHENKKLGLIFEAAVGRGKLLVCAADILSNLDERPVARQLRCSILQYMDGGKFQPKFALGVEQLQRLLQ